MGYSLSDMILGISLHCFYGFGFTKYLNNSFWTAACVEIYFIPNNLPIMHCIIYSFASQAWNKVQVVEVMSLYYWSDLTKNEKIL